MTKHQCWQILFLALTASFATLNVLQEKQSSERPAEPRKADVDFSKSVQLYRSLCLQDFDDELAEMVYGMHGQPWIVKKLKIDNGTPVFLSMGYSPESFGNMWLDPDPALIQAISSKRVRSVGQAKEGDIVVIVENVDWESATLVNLDISTYHEDLGRIHGSVDVRLEFEDNKWSVTYAGGCFTREIAKR